MTEKFAPVLSIAEAILASTLLAGCVIGPKYHTPTATVPPAYKEVTPQDMKEVDNWKVAQPSDTTIRGKWWEMFNDPELNQLEEQADAANQSIASAYASFLASRALVREARSQLFPSLTTSPSITKEHQSPNLVLGQAASSSTTSISSTFAEYILPFDATWVPDLWGRLRQTLRSNVYNAQASAADLENVRLTIQAEVASDYLQLRDQDSLKQLFDSTVVAYRQSLDLTQALYETGIDSEESVAQAQTVLDTALAQDTNIGIARAQFEHALAMLTGQPASTFAVSQKPLNYAPPPVPLSVPSQILERRPDVAAGERLVAAANAQIGIAQSAYFPTLTLTAAGGFESSSFSNWLSWPSRFWSIGAAGAETIFDAGLRHATVMQFRAQYDETVANYRQAVLTAFQQVEDELASLRILSKQIAQQDAAVQAAQHNLDLATERYKLGIDPYLNVTAAQTILLTNQQTAVTLRGQEMVATVGLVEDLGGGWNRSLLPTGNQLVAGQSPTVGPPPSPGASTNRPAQTTATAAPASPAATTLSAAASHPTPQK
ncbi:MAG TPA: efflux transporter outer membrane subunit [Candidatus Cybelea sp.]|nr:efflux transporter outer membrane subunit [Candidatus Cybelea sp.]